MRQLFFLAILFSISATILTSLSSPWSQCSTRSVRKHIILRMVDNHESPAPSPQPAGFTSESAHAASPSMSRPSEAVHTALERQEQKPVRCMFVPTFLS